MDTVVTVDGLYKTYGDVVAVRDVGLEVRRGEIFGILGPNGAGKTTTVECMQGLIARDSGRLEVLGLDPGRQAERLRALIGSQLQSAALPERIQVREAVRLFAKLRAEPVNVDAVLEEWDLAGLRRRAFAALSGGQRQRLFLALAMLGEPELVFLDELTTGLDPAARRATWELVRQVRDRGATVVLVTHFMEEAEALCDRVAVVDDGRVIALDSPEALCVQHGGSTQVQFTAAGVDPGFLAAEPGVESATTDGGRVSVHGDGEAAVRVAAALARNGVFPSDFRTRHPCLEDVFLSLTGRTMNKTESS